MHLQEQGPISSCRQLDWEDHIRTDTRASIQTNLFKLSFGHFLSFKFHAKKRPNDNLKDLCLYFLLYQSLYDLPNPTLCNLKSVLALTNALGRNLISVLGLTNSLGRKLIPVLVLTCPLMCQEILLILLCLAAPFLTAPGCFCP